MVDVGSWVRTWISPCSRAAEFRGGLVQFLMGGIVKKGAKIVKMERIRERELSFLGWNSKSEDVGLLWVECFAVICLVGRQGMLAFLEPGLESYFLGNTLVYIVNMVSLD